MLRMVRNRGDQDVHVDSDGDSPMGNLPAGQSSGFRVSGNVSRSPVPCSSNLSGSAPAAPVPVTKHHQSLIAACWFSIGEKVVVEECEAIVRYIGPVRAKRKKSKGIYVGVEFEHAIGKSDGSVDGIRYFTCEQRHGLFVQPHKVQPCNQITQTAGDDLSKLGHYAPQLPPDEKAAWVSWNRMDQLEEAESLVTARGINLVDQEMLQQFPSDEFFSRATSQGILVDSVDSPFETASSVSSFVTGLSCKSAMKTAVMTEAALQAEPIAASYKGPHLEGRPTKEFAAALLDHYRENYGEKLPGRYVLSLLSEMESHLNETIPGGVLYFDMSSRTDSQLIVVGDVHGQLNDVLWLFYKFGPPSAGRTYLFNGDIVDRGSNAVEILLLLITYKLAFPNSILLNRGNHESADMNEIYGFGQEVRSKYGSWAFQRFQRIFNLLPLCIVIEKRILVVHGGLFREDGLTLEEINAVDRQRPCPSTLMTRHDRIMFDLLWSDPREQPGRGPSGRGAECVAFGPDVTERFLTENNLDVCIRSHQVPTTLRGFEPVHLGRCVTVFSASNYCGTSGNYGAVIVFGSRLNFEIQEYMAPKLEDVREIYLETKMATAKIATLKTIQLAEEKARLRTRRTSIANMERDLVQKLSRIICEKRDAIWNACLLRDEKKTGTLTPEVLLQCLAEAVGVVGLPWSILLRKLRLTGAGKQVLYEDFLAKFRVEFRPKAARHATWRLETVQQVFESIMKADLNLKETLMVFDRNSDGTVCYHEFFELLSELKLGLSEPQVRLLMRIITAHHLAAEDSSRTDADPVGRVDVAEFLGRFKVVYRLAMRERDRKEEPWIMKALAVIGKAILADKADLARRHYESAERGISGPAIAIERRRSSALRSAALFQKFKDVSDADCGTGYLSYQMFIDAIRRLPIASLQAELGFELTDDRLIRLARAVDLSRSGQINYLEFLNAFHVIDNNTTANLAEWMWQQICASFFQQKVALRRALSHLDRSGTGRVDPDDFRSALMTLNAVLGPSDAPLTPEQIDLVVTSIDTEEDGMVDYNDFLESFVVMDFVESTDSDLAERRSPEESFHQSAIGGLTGSKLTDAAKGDLELPSDVSSSSSSSSDTEGSIELLPSKQRFLETGFPSISAGVQSLGSSVEYSVISSSDFKHYSPH